MEILKHIFSINDSFQFIPYIFSMFSTGSQNKGYLPNNMECEDDQDDRDYNPCKGGYYCTDDLCSLNGKTFDCCKPRLDENMFCDDHKDCKDGLYCEEVDDLPCDDCDGEKSTKVKL